MNLGGWREQGGRRRKCGGRKRGFDPSFDIAATVFRHGNRITVVISLIIFMDYKVSISDSAIPGLPNYKQTRMETSLDYRSSHAITDSGSTPKAHDWVGRVWWIR